MAFSILYWIIQKSLILHFKGKEYFLKNYLCVTSMNKYSEHQKKLRFIVCLINVIYKYIYKCKIISCYFGDFGQLYFSPRIDQLCPYCGSYVNKYPSVYPTQKKSDRSVRPKFPNRCKSPWTCPDAATCHGMSEHTAHAFGKQMPVQTRCAPKLGHTKPT